MPNPFFERLRPGQAPSADQWNALAEAVSQLGYVSGTAFGGVGVSRGVGGVQILDGRERGHWARIGSRGTGAAYAHTAVAPNGDGTFSDIADDFAASGTTTRDPAREVNGDTGVGSGAVVWLWPDQTEDSPGWLFDGGSDCCGWGADFWSRYYGGYGPGSIADFPLSLDGAFVSTTGEAIATQYVVEVPAGTGRFVLRGKIAVQLGMTDWTLGTPYGGNLGRSHGYAQFNVLANVVELSGLNGSVTAQITSVLPVISAQLVPGPNSGQTTILGPRSPSQLLPLMDSVAGWGLGWATWLATSPEAFILLDQSPSAPRYFAWRATVAGVANVGTGGAAGLRLEFGRPSPGYFGTSITYELVCCADDATQPRPASPPPPEPIGGIGIRPGPQGDGVPPGRQGDAAAADPNDPNRQTELSPGGLTRLTNNASGGGT